MLILDSGFLGHFVGIN